MKNFKVGDGFIYCPDNKVCLLEITKIFDWDQEKQCKKFEFKRYTYIGNTCTYNEKEFETGSAFIYVDHERNKEYTQLEHWFTHKYCIKHIVYCE